MSLWKKNAWIGAVLVTLITLALNGRVAAQTVTPVATPTPAATPETRQEATKPRPTMANAEDEDGLLAWIMSRIEKRLDQAVAEGDLTPQGADKIYDRIEAALRFFGQHWGHGHRHERMAVRVGLHDVLAETFGMTVDELQAARRDGQSIAQLATQQGLDQAAFQTAFTKALDAHLQQAVADGVLPQTHADRLRERILTRALWERLWAEK